MATPTGDGGREGECYQCILGDQTTRPLGHYTPDMDIPPVLMHDLCWMALLHLRLGEAPK